MKNETRSLRAGRMTRRRLDPQERMNQIVAEATRYFAKNGFAGGTIELAKQIGITQPLLYRYFRTKAALIEKVYETVFPGHWNPHWEELLEDATIPLGIRLSTFYKEYADVMLTYENVRLFLFTGLSQLEYNARYYRALTDRVFVRIARALRQEILAQDQRRGRVSAAELEIVQSLHAMIYHLGLRRWIHTPPLEADLHDLIDEKVEVFLAGAVESCRRVLARNGVKK